MKTFLDIDDNPRVRSMKGPPGPSGEDGLSAYQIAVLNGFVGSEELWIQSLKGDKGDQGLKGDTGENILDTFKKYNYLGTEEELVTAIIALINKP